MAEAKTQCELIKTAPVVSTPSAIWDARPLARFFEKL